MTQYIKRIPHVFYTRSLEIQLAANPDLWDQISYRTAPLNSPHREVSDIWIRYNPLEHFQGDWETFNGEHEAAWYPAAEKLPAAKQLSLDLASSLGMALGGVLITRIPPGGQVYPHVDGGWHARSHEKYIIQVTSAPGQLFCYENEALDAWPGECYWFDNSVPHWVINPTSRERISLIICLRRPSCR